MTSGVAAPALPFDPAEEMAGPGFRADPYPFYAVMRERAPVHRVRGAWLISRCADVEAALADPRMSSDRDRMTAALGSGSPVVRELSRLTARLGRVMSNTDAPEHSRLRRLVSRGFTARRVERLRGDVQRVVDGLLDGAGSELDVVGDLAMPLASAVICELFAVPEADRPRVHGWFAVLRDLLADVARSEQVVGEFHEYLSWLAARRREQPGQDVVSALVAAQAEDDRLTEEELLSTCYVIITAGDETTTHLIGNGVLALLRHPEQLALLRARPDLVGRAVDECARYDSPTQVITRVLAADLELGGQLLREGDIAYLGLASANRDPRRHADPDLFDLARSGRGSLAFGHGPHFCLGASLARLEVELAIGSLVRASPGLRLRGDGLEWHRNPLQRKLIALPVVRWDAPLSSPSRGTPCPVS
ncbi:cytochrome P450 [Actinosynnema pretiosum]|uniref:Cytochrome n=1 Tax=Actinosynnema pretiosum TaxID=42197 RepID=A0A290Z7M9_9PSEU|nr:cytochrome P450 [Actinosynnema pretiosum]ATE54979.1 cytochrome [Actinosynnema pretiosum]